MSGTLNGFWSGYIVRVQDSSGDRFMIEVKEGVRGINIPVTVTVDEYCEWSVLYLNDPLTVVNVSRAIVTSSTSMFKYV